MRLIILVVLNLSSMFANPIVDVRSDGVADDYRGFRLPNIQIPSKYEVSLFLNQSVFDGSVTSFNGTARITFQVTKKTDKIQIHSSVTHSSIELENSTIGIITPSLNGTTEILTIPLNSTLEPSVNYFLVIKYTGQIDIRTMKGFYRSSFNNENGSIEYLLTTQFQPTHARKAFPCFDEPQFKARFVISITYPKGYKALSNTPRENLPVDLGTGYETTTFKETPLTSTYLIAFIVSKFTCTGGINIDTDVPYRVCSRNGSLSDRDLAVEYGPLFIEALENITAIKYTDHNIGKMDLAAIPDFDAGAMENWGLVTFRERALLWNENESSNAFKQSILETVAHEFTHMWFGNLVTCEWWDYTFLNEGFARFFEYFAITKVSKLNHFEMDKQFVIDQQQSAFVSDSTVNSTALTSRAATPSEVSRKFSTISYNKGAAIFRMVENFMGTDNFYNGIRSYLNTKANKSAVPEDLWLALQPHYLQLNVSEIMTNWTIHAGFPLVTVTSSGNDVVLSQKRFLYSGEDDTQWYVPISYTVSSDPNKFESVSPKIWLKPGTTETIPNVLETNSWIILNNKESAYYRVNYDSSLWSRIERALRTDHTQIDVLNRAQIVDDSLNLARAGILKYSEVLKILNYLKNETDYYPWSSALGGLNFLTVRLGEGSVLGKKVESLMLDLMEGVYRSVSFTDLTEYDQIYTLKLVLVLRRACKLAKANCLNTAKVLFKDFKDGKSVDKNRKSIVYCYGLRYSEDVESDWTFMWDKYQNTSLSTEQVTILSTLGCTNNTNLLKKYLDLSINGSSGIRTQELPTVWSSVYSSNPEGVDVALDYLVENHQKIYQYYPEAASLIANVAARLSRDDQVKKLESFVALETLHPSMKSAATSAIDSVKANIKWTSNIKSDLEQYFNEDNNNSTTSTAPVTPVTPAGAANISLSVSLMAIIVIMIFDICFKMLPLGLVIVYLTKILASPLVNISVDETTVNDGGYRLPTTQIPSRYEINLTFPAAVFDGHETSFEGIVRITFQVTEKRDSIQIHAPVKIISMKLDNIAHAIGDASLNTTTEILTIPLKMMLQPQTNYVITIKYRGQLGMRVFEGIYRSSYKNANGIPEYLVTTQFQATYARKAFPCFDEPKFKARFVISITYPRGFNALSNAPQVGPPLVDRDAVYETATFKETPIMSTYLIAFIVSKFTCTAANTDIDMPYQAQDFPSQVLYKKVLEKNSCKSFRCLVSIVWIRFKRIYTLQNTKTHTSNMNNHGEVEFVCSRNELASLRTFALEYGPKFLKVLENVTAYKFNDHHIGKIDHIGIPDFESEGMENYGVVTYEEGILLHDQNQPSLERTDITLSIIAHETAHMWFGNLVTCEWWDYLFLNEGLASYFQFFVPSQISEFKYYEMDKQFIVQEHQLALISDSSTDSLALASAAVTSSEVQEKFDDIAYEKGGATSSAVPEDLWRALQIYFLEPNLSQIMNNWINHPGFPLVTVTSNGSDVILSQKRFLNDGTDDIQWFVPISFTLSSDINKFEAVYPMVWLKPGINTTLPNVLQNASWIILNSKESAFYRVNYDSTLWREIRTILYTNHTEIDVLNRAQIVDDSLNLAKARILTYSEAFKNVIYLISETEYFPWVPAFRTLLLLKTRLGENSVLEKNVDSFMLELMEGVYNSVSFTKLDENDHIYMLKLNLVLGQACKLEKPDCVKTAKKLFKNLRQGKSINKNLKPIVYCNGLRYSNNIEEDWEFLWNKYQSTEVPIEKKIILEALGCTKNITILKKYLEYSVNDSYGIRTHDVPTVWSSVFSSSSEVLMWRWIICGKIMKNFIDTIQVRLP
ncbi:uncharacterized protein [Leptinotarsa decemlineata]|uniref:uncharacterized protein n=1 Tax=Leptinotarsa decemlineata TaxID=7539 RepID=UPI003D306F2B